MKCKPLKVCGEVYLYGCQIQALIKAPRRQNHRTRPEAARPCHRHRCIPDNLRKSCEEAFSIISHGKRYVLCDDRIYITRKLTISAGTDKLYVCKHTRLPLLCALIALNSC
jgi:hypothetical protein